MKCHNCGRAIVAKGWKRSWVELDGFVYCFRSDCYQEAEHHRLVGEELEERGKPI